MHGADTKITSCTLARDLKLFQLTRSYLVQLFLGIWRSSILIQERKGPSIGLLLSHHTPCSFSNATMPDLCETTTSKLYRMPSLSSNSLDARLFCWQVGRGTMGWFGGNNTHLNFWLSTIQSGLCNWKLGLWRILKILTTEAMCGYGKRIYCPA